MSNKRTLVISGSAILVVVLIVAAVLAFTHPTQTAAPIPVTGGNSSGVSAANQAISPQKIDLGAGYWLEMDAKGGRIIPPATIIRPADKTIEMGDGYRLVITSSGGQIVPPARPSTYFKQTDLGDGYVLVETGDTGYIIPPSNPAKYQLPAPAIQKTYLGDGYWLIIGPDGGKIVSENSK
jgi:hypothetical protein